MELNLIFGGVGLAMAVAVVVALRLVRQAQRTENTDRGVEEAGSREHGGCLGRTTKVTERVEEHGEGQRQAEEARDRAAEQTGVAVEQEARGEAEDEARVTAEQEARREAEDEARVTAEQEARVEAEDKARDTAEQEARGEAEDKARDTAEQEARGEAEDKARVAAEQEARREAEDKARVAAEREAKREAEDKARVMAEQEARREAEDRARVAAEREARREAEDKDRDTAEQEARREAEDRARVAAEREAKREAEDKARVMAEQEARREAEDKAGVTAEQEAKGEAEDKARVAALLDEPNVPHRDPRQYRPTVHTPTAPRKPAREVTEAGARDRALPIEVRLVFEKAGFCRISLLPRRAAGMPSELLMSGTGNPSEFTALQDEWYQDVVPTNLETLLKEGIEWAGQLPDGRAVRSSLSGRELYVLARHNQLNGFVSSPRLVLGEEHVVICVEERLDEVRDAIRAHRQPGAYLVELRKRDPHRLGWPARSRSPQANCPESRGRHP